MLFQEVQLLLQPSPTNKEAQLSPSWDVQPKHLADVRAEIQGEQEVRRLEQGDQSRGHLCRWAHSG